ncbi:putative Na+/H+ antiporter [Aromatoleum toluclasticum]|uniref:putative Na+/H+ antiporter n=1 Tax=Aromatoleum toluclasticum TaxID=92003 RepID=UPI00037AF067|nr:putative Na+/H+ antiporter [Aromatoleum toluclasticum]MCC4118036.1 putative Na+/H+ antiporter [Aromatoleum toluclasticum]
MTEATTVQMLAAGLFALAIIHTFSTKFFEQLAHRHPAHAGVFHLLGEVEVVFGFWAMVLIVAMGVLAGRADAIAYLDSRNFTEPMFVFAIMVIAGSRPILRFSLALVRMAASFIPLHQNVAFYFVTMALVPLLGSFITEPAAMTLAAMILRDKFFANGISNRLMYATIGTLFVNISIGGTLTPFAAPPVLMVAGTWGWDIWFMIATFGWKALIAVVFNGLVVTMVFRQELAALDTGAAKSSERMPMLMVVIHLLFLAGVVAFAHHPAVFMGLLLFFLGFVTAYKRYQDRLILREGLLVAFFLAGLVVLGGQQQWWLQPLLTGMDATTVYFGATALTAVTDNAALTYLGSLVQGLSPEFKYALVAGAVTGGGLTIIANAPNPAGFAILRGHFPDEAIHPVGLLLSALPPTLVAIVAFQVL